MSATVWRRFQAFLLDYLLIFGYLLLLVLLSTVLFPSIQSLFTGSPLAAQFSGFLLVTLPVSLYFILSDSVFEGQSAGKRKMGIRTVRENGGGLSAGRAIFRTALKFLPWELSHFLVYRLAETGNAPVPAGYTLVGVLIYGLMLLYIATAVFSKRRQSVYDRLAGTLVVDERKSFPV